MHTCCRHVLKFCSLSRFAAVFLWDSGSTVGDLACHSKVINSVDIRQKRPYRLITGSDDNSSSFFEGPPFKFKFTATVSSALVFNTSLDDYVFKTICGRTGQIFKSAVQQNR